MSMKKDDLTSEVHWAVLSHLAHMACTGQDMALMSAGFDAKLIGQLKKQSFSEMRALSQTICGRQCAIDIDALRHALEVSEIPNEVIVFLQLGCSNKALSHFFFVNGKVSSHWRKMVKPKEAFRQRCVPPSQIHVLWKALEQLPINNVQRINQEQIVAVAQQCQLSIGAIWAEICDGSQH
ncbi:STY4526/YPO1902 family pathogenicity island replication protein [Vibrio sp. 10N.261.46.E12]|uniref:STY4526/YPO1902 family pathogenicity island replication protein n=2 Tax=unclassified Vibrio TaxID=2614977 RepID=UPI0009755790|nr:MULTISPECIES: STY4526/YPO1902 family pathogenicity island replication protein [unclassified Vibrio]PMN88636.1 hypothetical protein BCT22_26580 [Vibrio sp. 10N.261.45.A1]PMN89166.1 hypothetical protein BCT25_24950 [Vibrio sp. 10N.261.45.A6]CAH7030441.1 conserved hypothetical protein [Vibrio chagasii]OMO34708.1 hypothetical protein BH584_12330 [Vibrio sp. 10N.261.45.E1]PMJ33891.1 hypothetical protein BCU27_24950 [Vibrio sp. 10N.286.45.B6]